MVDKYPIDPTYKKDSGLWSLRTDQLPLPKNFEVRERNLVYIPPGKYGGNHKHPRGEAFVGVGDELYIVWQDEHGQTHEDRMMDDERSICLLSSPLRLMPS